MEERFTNSFTGLDISDNVNVFLTQSPNESVTVEAGKNIVSNIKTKVKDGTLHIENNNTCNWIRDYDKKVNVFINSNYINNITYRGFGEVKTIGTYSSQHFFVDMWMASGGMDLNLACDSVFLKSHTGTADIICRGTAKTVIVYMNGTGTIDAKALKSEYVLAINRDVGDAYVNVEKKLDAEIFSRGNIYYSGKAEEVSFVDKGEGKLIKYH